jgi:hypothetical protein
VTPPLYSVRHLMTLSQRARFVALVRDYVELRNEVFELAASTTDGRLASPRSSLHPEHMK